MKKILLATFLLLEFSVICQISIKNQKESDSLIKFSKNIDNSIKSRANALSRSVFINIYADVSQGLAINDTYYKFALSNKLQSHVMTALHFKGYGFLILGKIDSSLYYHNKGLILASENKNYKKMVQAYADLGNLMEIIGDHSKALLYYNKSLQIATTNDFKVVQARAKINIANIYEKQSKYKLSILTCQEAMKLCEENGLTGFMSSVNESLGDVYLSIEEYPTARKYYNLSLSYSIKYPNINRRIQALRKIAKLYQVMINPEKALEYYNKGLTLAKEENSNLHISTLLFGISSVYFDQEKYADALRLVNMSIDLSKKIQNNQHLDEIYLLAGEINFHLKKMKISQSFCELSYTIAKKKGNITTLVSSVYFLAQIHKKLGNNMQSLKFHEEYIKLIAIERSKDQIKEILKMELNTIYTNKSIKDSLNQANNVVLINLRHKHEQEREKLNVFIAYSILSFIVVLLLAMLFFFVQKSKTNKLLAHKNSIISLALKDKEILLKEVHHRVKNNMQVVSSLLQLKSKNTTNQIVKDALLDSQQRIDSMQLAHQKMYQNGNYAEINIQEYCQDILMMLLYPIQREKDVYEVQGEELYMNVEQAQAIGFIIHELITNSIKHAWPDDSERKLFIKIKAIEKKIQITYTDNGIGLTEGFNLGKTKSFGLKLVHSLVARQLLGKIDSESNNGLKFSINFTPR